MSMKFRNTRNKRRRKEDALPSKEATVFPIKVVKLWGVPNYLPKRCAGEDDKSIKRLVAVIQNEFKKISSNR